MPDNQSEFLKNTVSKVAEKYQVIIEKDDPIFAAIYLQEEVLQTYISKVEEAYGNINLQITESLEDTTHKYTELSKDLANQVVGQAISRTNEMVEKSVAEIDSRISSIIDKKTENFQRLQAVLIACTTLSAISALCMAMLVIL